MENQSKTIKQGFIPPIIDGTNWIFGSEQLLGDILRPDGNWMDYAPNDNEIQDRNGFEPADCVAFGLIHQVLTLLKEKFNVDVNYSEREVAIGSGIDPAQGGNPRAHRPPQRLG